jgi:hypothetical protein
MMTELSDSIAFCWRPVWFNRFESLWSLLRKFAYFNAATTKNLQDHLSAGAPVRYVWASAKRLDLRCYGGFDATRIAALLRIDRELLDESTILPFLAADEREVFASNRLRFCASCLDEGFHSSIHQILLITECPQHGEKLQEHCKQCGGAIDYVSCTAAIDCALGCNQCLPRVTRSDGNRRLRLRSSEREEQFREAAQWLRRRLAARADEYGPQWLAAKKSPAGRRLRISRVAAHWNAVLASNKGSPAVAARGTYLQFDCKCEGQVRAKASAGDDRNPLLSEQQRQLNGELLKILKAIRRYLNKLWLRPHRHCVTYLLRHERSSAQLERGSPCPYANVLILWRLYWEQFDDLFYLERRPARLHYGMEAPLRVRHFERALPSSLVQRVFVLECLAVLEECYLLVRLLRRRNLHTFLPAFLDQLKGRRMPYWIVERRPDEVLRLHVWKQSDRHCWPGIKFSGVPNPTKRGGECDNSPSRVFARTASKRRPFATK